MKRGFIAALAGLFSALGMVSSVSAAPPPLEAYAKPPTVSAMSLSPDGSKTAVITLDGEQRTLKVVDVGGKLVFAAPVANVPVVRVDWITNDLVLAYFAKVSDRSWDWTAPRIAHSGVVVDLAAHKAHVLFDRHPGQSPIVRGVHGYRQVNGRWVAYLGRTTRLPSEDYGHKQWIIPDLYQVDLLTDDITKVDASGLDTHNWLVDDKGAIIARSTYDEEKGRFTLEIHERQALTLDSPYHGAELAGFGPSYDTALVREGGDEEPRLTEVPLNGAGPARPFWQDFKWTRLLQDREQRLLGVIDAEEQHGRFATPLLQARYDGVLGAFRGRRVHLVSWTDDLGKMIVETSGGQDADVYWLVDVAAGSAKVLASGYPDIDDAQVAETRLVHYQAADGMALDGVLTLPPGRPAKALPVIILPHTGPVGLSTGIGFHWQAQAFASRGYAVFQPNYRGSSEHGEAYWKAGYGEWKGKILSDIDDGLAALAAAGTVDAGRACIIGDGFAGFYALSAATAPTRRYRCAVSVNGVSDFGEVFGWAWAAAGRHSAGSREARRIFGADKLDLDHVGADSPLRNAARATAPILLAHSKDDSTHPEAQSLKMQRALADAGKPVEFVELPVEDHLLVRGETRLQLLKAEMAFVQKYNPAD